MASSIHPSMRNTPNAFTQPAWKSISAPVAKGMVAAPTVGPIVQQQAYGSVAPLASPYVQSNVVATPASISSSIIQPAPLVTRPQSTTFPSPYPTAHPPTFPSQTFAEPPALPRSTLAALPRQTLASLPTLAGQNRGDVLKTEKDADLIYNEPPVWKVDNFLTDEEVEHIFSQAKDWKQSKAPPAHADGSARLSTDPTGTDKDTRTSYSSVLQPGGTPILERIEKKLSALAGMPTEHLECLVLLRYEPGQQFKEHHDGRNRPRTVFLYLNDMPPGTGGETEFPAIGLRVRPQKGMAIMWGNRNPDGTADKRMNHMGKPPTAGTKYGINCFFNENIVRPGGAAAKGSAPEQSFPSVGVSPQLLRPTEIRPTAPQQISPASHQVAYSQPQLTQPFQQHPLSQRIQGSLLTVR